MGTEELIQEYWDKLPKDLRIELIQDDANSKTILERAAKELGVEFERDDSYGHIKKNEIASFAVAVMDKYGAPGDLKGDTE